MNGKLSYCFASLVLALPDLAWACSVCGFGQDGSQPAYIFTTWLLSFVPLIFIFSVVYYIVKKVKAQEQAMQNIRMEDSTDRRAS